MSHKAEITETTENLIDQASLWKMEAKTSSCPHHVDNYNSLRELLLENMEHLIVTDELQGNGARVSEPPSPS